MTSTTAKRIIDLNSVDAVYRQRSSWMVLNITVCFAFALTWAVPFVIPIPVEGGETLPPVERFLFFLISPLIVLLGIYLIRSYRCELFRIQHGQLVHIGPSGKQKMRIPLTDVLETLVGGDGWTCTVKTRAGSFSFTTTLSNHQEFFELLDYAVKHNPTNINVEFSRELPRSSRSDHP